MKNNENGRSMVEMLGVLAIIALLSIAGLYGYTRVMTKHKANTLIDEVNKRAVVVAAQLASMGDDVSDEDLNDVYWEGDTFAGRDDRDIAVGRPAGNGDGSDFKVKKYPKGSKEFAVVIPKMEKDVCKEILNLLGSGTPIQALVNEAGYEIRDCDKEETLENVEVVYKDDLTTAEGNSTIYSDSDAGDGNIGGGAGGSDNSGGDNGYSGNSDSGDEDYEYDEDDPENICPRGEKISAGVCVMCPKYENCGCLELGMVANGQGYCMCPDEGVEECDGHLALSCSENYFLENNKCHPCPGKYETCDNDGLTCPQNYEKQGLECVCQAGFFMQEGECYPCPDNAESCTNDGFVCKGMYYKEDLTCKSCLEYNDFKNWTTSHSLADYNAVLDKCNSTCPDGHYARYSNTNSLKRITGSCSDQLPEQKMRFKDLINSLNDTELIRNCQTMVSRANNSTAGYNSWGKNLNCTDADAIRQNAQNRLNAYYGKPAGNMFGRFWNTDTWYSAQSFCRRSGGTLATVSTEMRESWSILVPSWEGNRQELIMWSGWESGTKEPGKFLSTRHDGDNADNAYFVICK